MPSIIDALVMTLGLDTRDFDKGKKKVDQDLKQSRVNAEREAKLIEEAGKRASQYFTRMRNEAIALFAAFTGINGIKSFVADTVTAEAATTRLAHNIGLTTQELTAWQEASKQFGGTSEGTAASFKSMSDEITQFQLTGSSAMVQYLRSSAIGVDIADRVTGKARKLTDIYIDLSAKLQKLTPQQATAFGSALHLDQGMINLLRQGPDEVRRQLAEAAKRGVVTDEMGENAIRLEQDFLRIKQQLVDTANQILNALAPSLHELMLKAEAWITTNKPWLTGEIVKHITEFTNWLAGLNFDPATNGMNSLLDRVNAVIDKFGGLTEIIKTLLEVWLGVKIIGAIANVARLLQLLAFVPGSGVSIAALAVLGIGYTLLNPDFIDANEREKLDKLYPNRPQGQSTGGFEPPHPELGKFLSRLGFKPPLAADEFDPNQEGFLKTLSQPESGGAYNVKNGGYTFSDYSKFPEGIAPGGSSTAAGRYQFTSETWARVSKILGLTDFSPANQDRAAWYLAKETYRTNTGRDLQVDLHDPKREAGVAIALRKVWPSLPGGSQSHITFAAYQQSLAENKAPSAAVAPGRGPRVVSNSPRISHANSNVQTGDINIYTQATDAQGISRSVGRALNQELALAAANRGLSP